MTGSFDRSGSPIISIEVGGTYPRSFTTFDAVIDTGFSGFISLPIQKAFPLGLVLLGIYEITLADGSKAEKLAADARIKMGNDIISGPALLEPGSDEVLLGMQFLKRANRTLFLDVSSNKVELHPLP